MAELDNTKASPSAIKDSHFYWEKFMSFSKIGTIAVCVILLLMAILLV